MSIVTATASSSHLILSSRLVSELAARSTLRTATEHNGQAVIVHVGGELDACNEAIWRRLLSEAAAAASPPGPLVIDASGLDFMGCCAFAVLTDEAERCRRRGVALRLVSVAAVVARIVHACDLSDVLPLHHSVDAALSASSVW
jgi:anti-anti-sigma factor